ncbi:hypothetical protein F5Y15DRAFT_143634 [Xylariaceae sp. FL0016]|nr:hypothetical protein F5Y15DRAFT_143634 [Xylariaceae sp. FL0016]
MKYLTTLGSLLLASGVTAIPATKTFVVPRNETSSQSTDPSSYPGGDSPECTNEFKYLNFDVNDETQLTHVRSAHEAFCTGWSQLLVFGSENIDDDDTTIFARFFDNTPDTKDEVGQVYSALVDTSNGEAQSIVADMILDNTDFLGRCSESGGSDDEAVEEGGYWGIDTDGREKFHICDATYDFPTNPPDNDCSDLGDHPDISMETLARLILHEMLHFKSVGPPIFNSQIRDVDNEDGLAAYYPQRAHGLVDPEQDNSDGENAINAVTNADSYGWHATNSYYKYACNNVEEPGPNGGNWNDPPHYTKDEPGDA